MDVTAGLECRDESGVTRKLRQETQLDLRMVCRDEQAPGGGNEASSNITSQLTANRNVLKIRVARRKAARCRDGLIEGGMNPISPRIHERRQRVDVRALELRLLSVFHEFTTWLLIMCDV